MGKSSYASHKGWRARNPEKVAEQRRRHKEQHPEAVVLKDKKYRTNNVGKIKKYQREYDRDKKEELAGRPRPDACELCGEPGKVVFDHCHKHGHFRGWICGRCNKVLGLIRDSVELAMELGLYLERNRGG